MGRKSQDQVIIDCNKQSDGYCLRVNPKFKHRIKNGSPSSIFIGFDDTIKTNEMGKLRWKTLVKILLGLQRLVPCVIRQPIIGEIYFKFDKKEKRIKNA